MTSGDFYRYLLGVRKVYLQRRDDFISLLNHHLADYGEVVKDPQGCLVVFLLSIPVSDQAIVEHGRKVNLDLMTLSEFCYQTSGNGLVMGYVAFN